MLRGTISCALELLLIVGFEGRTALLVKILIPVRY